MPGLGTHLRAMDLTLAKLTASGDPQQLALANMLNANLPAAYLGALGPAIGDFMPSDPVRAGQPGGNQYVELWKRVFDVVGGDGTAAKPGLLAILTKMTDFLDRVEAIAIAEDTDALKAMAGEIDVINQTAAGLAAVVDEVRLQAPIIASIIGTGLKPAANVAVGANVPPSLAWSVRDLLHWSHPGRFAQALVARANAEPDAARRGMFQAYAYGYLIGFSTQVGGAPFVNSIVNATYREQRWRTRWVQNWIDVWVHGFYETPGAMTGDTPTPLYTAWKDICDADLQKKIEFGAVDPVQVMAALRSLQPLPASVPADLGQFWLDAFTGVYGAAASGSRVKPTSLNGAAVMTWMALWFQTSGKVIGCNPSPPMAPPGDCGTTPSWTDPAKPGDNGSGTGPPSPSVSTQTNTAQTVSGILLALLGVVGFIAGGWVAGAAAIAGGIELIIHSVHPDWQKLRCDLYWYRLYVYNGLAALHEILSFGGLGYPYARELAVDQAVEHFSGLNFPYETGWKLVKSRRVLEGFPTRAWDGQLSTWILRPTTLEPPPTAAYLSAEYPSFFVDDSANAVSGQEVRIGGAWPYRQQAGSQLPVQFGNAVDNAIDLILRGKDGPPDWNLDADRGLAYQTWQHTGGVISDPVAIEPEP